jgi:hypothetical protein
MLNECKLTRQRTGGGDAPGWQGVVAALTEDFNCVNLPSDDADFACLTLGRTNDDIDVSSEARQHAEKTLGGKSAQLARDDERDLRRSVAHDVRGFSLRKFLIIQDLRNFFGENFLGDHRLGDRPRAALRFSSGHGLLG